MAQRTWFITGTSRGFGREWALAALARGDRVVGTARDPRSMDDIAAQHGTDEFLPLALDVTDRDAVFAAVKQAHAHFGELDIVVNNAGYGQFGMVEELSEQELRDQFETNLFGAIWVTQAALPYLRERGAGHFLQVSSIGGVVSTGPGIAAYQASKWALECFSEGLSYEIAPFGIDVTLIEPGGFATDWGGSSARRAPRMDIYAQQHEARAKVASRNPYGDPAASSAAIMRVVDAEEPPLRCFFGTRPLSTAEAAYASRIETWREWQPVAELAQGGS